MELLKKIKPDEIKKMGIFFCVALFLLVILLKYLFLIPKISASRSYENSLRSQIKNYVTRIAVISAINKEELEKELELLDKRFPKKEEIPIVLDGLEQLGKKAGVEINSITQQNLGQPVAIDVKVKGESYKFSYQASPLIINLSCSYIKFADFLETLDNWSGGIVVVKGFSIQKDESITEKLKIKDLVIEIPTIGDGNK